MSYFDDDSEWKSYPDAVKEILFLFAILPGMHTPRSVAEYIRIVTGRIVSADGLRIGIHRLWEDDYIDKWDNLNNKHAFMDVKYKYCGDLDWDDLCEIGHLATTSKWWPARSLITGEEWMNWVKNDRSLRSADKDDSFQVWRGFELMRAIIGCDKSCRLPFIALLQKERLKTAFSTCMPTSAQSVKTCLMRPRARSLPPNASCPS